MSDPKIYVLLVEDDIDYSSLLRRRLMGNLNRDSNYTFIVAQTGLLCDAVDYAQTNAVTVIVLDLNLPDATGLETLARMRTAAPDAATIVLTGRDDQELAGQAVKMGAQDYLYKGHFNTELLVRAIRYAIDRKASERALSDAQAQLQSLHQQSRATEHAAPRAVNGNRTPTDPENIATDVDALLDHMATQNSLALAQLGNDNPARVHVEKLHQTIHLAADLTKRLFRGLRNGS